VVVTYAAVQAVGITGSGGQIQLSRNLNAKKPRRNVKTESVIVVGGRALDPDWSRPRSSGVDGGWQSGPASISTNTE
jgi:hypothetical protein